MPQRRITAIWALGILREVSSHTVNSPCRDVSTLTARVASGDEAAFQEFYDTYSPQVFRFLLVLVRGNEEIAEELHQQVMIKVARKMRRIEDEQQLWKWLSQVARNAWRDLLRKQHREELRLNLFESGFTESVPPPDDFAVLLPALESLPKEQRELIQSFYIEGTKQKEMASRAGLSVKAIQSELARIRKKLREFIQGRKNDR